MRTALRWFALIVVLLSPVTALAQATLSGTVRDDSGAVLPGVSVEASSPALIEQTRSVVTDGTGQYRIVDLQPGTYALTFTLPGFTAVKREGIQLSGSQTITIAIALKVGGLERGGRAWSGSPPADLPPSRSASASLAGV